MKTVKINNTENVVINNVSMKNVSLFQSVINYLPEISFYAICFFVPFILGHPQLFVGSIVNAALIYAAFESKSNWNLIPLSLTPSLAVLTRGLIFGPLTVYLLYMIPFIWISNLLLVFTIRKFKNKKIFSIGLGTMLKVFFLAGSAYLLLLLGIIPNPIFIGMSLVQIYTLIIGILVSYPAILLKHKFLG